MWKTHKELKLGKAQLFQQTPQVSSDGPCVKSSGNLSCIVNSLAAFTFISVKPGLQSPTKRCFKSGEAHLPHILCSLLLKGTLSPWRVGEMHPSLPTAVPASHGLVCSEGGGGGLHSSSGGVWQDGHWDTHRSKRGLQALRDCLDLFL